MSRSPYPIDPQHERDTTHRPTAGRLDSWPTPEYRPVERGDSDEGDPRTADRSVRQDRVPESLDSSRAHYTRDRTYFLRDSELQTLAEVGTFRAVAAPDLARLSYGGDTARMEREIRRLKQQSLLSEKTVRGGRNKTIRSTRSNQDAVRALSGSRAAFPEGQALYHGFRETTRGKTRRRFLSPLSGPGRDVSKGRADVPCVSFSTSN